MTKLLTPAQVADLLKVAPSTIRRWSADFERHLSPTARPGHGRKRSYSPADLAVFQRAADLLRAGKTPEEVDDLLGVVADQGEALSGLEVATLPELAGELAQSRDLLRRLAEELRQSRETEARLVEDLKKAQETAQAAHEGEERLAGELTSTRAKVDDLEARLAALEEQGRGNWLARLFKRRPPAS